MTNIKQQVPIVGIGASAGGVKALQAFVKNISHKSGYVYIIIQHLSPLYKSVMDDILRKNTSLPISIVEDKQPVEVNHIYLLPANKHMIIQNNVLLLSDRDNHVNTAINIFFSSLARDAKKQAIGVILSGTGNDGAEGMKKIREFGGHTIVQSEASAEFDGMPKAAIQTGIAEFVLEPEDMPELIASLHSENHNGKMMTTAVTDPTIENIEIIFKLFRHKYNIEFQHYKASTVNRRIERRIQMLLLPSLAEYVNTLQGDEDELDHLYKDLLIGVTNFFRDPEVYQYIQENILKTLVINNPTELRIWIAACATGEEAYSLAILVNEYLLEKNLDIDIKIFATDIHRSSIDHASKGLYDEEVISDMPIELRNKYFKKENHFYKINSHIRNMIIFAVHDLIKDPPFTNIDFVSCRNMLIYLTHDAQQYVFELFHFALKKEGLLLLGSSESIGNKEDIFTTVSSKQKVYQKNAVKLKYPFKQSNHTPQTPIAAPPFHSFNRKHEKELLSAYELFIKDQMESGFLLDEDFELLHIMGDAVNFLELQVGAFNKNILDMVNKKIEPALSTLLYKAKRTKKTLKAENLSVNYDNKNQIIDITAIPLFNESTKACYFFISINPKDTKERKEVLVLNVENNTIPIEHINELQSELDFTREHLQTLNEELESSNEELQTTNEELLATNEEIQSTNEELQSANEELQSTNQELHIINNQYQRKITENNIANDDILNLLNISNNNIIIIDKAFNIRRYSYACKSILRIADSDIGRDLFSVLPVNKSANQKLMQAIQETIETNQIGTIQISTTYTIDIEVTIHPYKTKNQTPDNAILLLNSLPQNPQE